MDDFVTSVFALSAVALVAVMVATYVAIVVLGWIGAYRRQRDRTRRITEHARDRTHRAGKQ